MRTRDTSGVVHFAGASRLSLSDIFWVWGVRFNAHCLGGYCGGTSSSRRLRVFVDGASLHGDDPTQLPLAARMDITVTFGAVKQLPRPIPSGYRFRGG